MSRTGTAVHPDGWRFDFAAADEASRQLESTAASLRDAVAVVKQKVPDTVEDWQGRFCEVFDVHSAEQLAGALLLADDLLRLAAAVRAQAVLASASITQAEAAQARAEAEAERERAGGR